MINPFNIRLHIIFRFRHRLRKVTIYPVTCLLWVVGMAAVVFADWH
jgi:hypothetical protein